MDKNDFYKDLISKSMKSSLNNMNEYIDNENAKKSKLEKLELRLKKWYNQPVIGFIIAFVMLLFSFYQLNQNNDFQSKIHILNFKVDSLNTKLDLVNNQYDSLVKDVSDVKQNIEEKN